MKKYWLLLILCFLIPFNVFAKGKINVYLFKIEECPYCNNALEYFQNIDDEYKDYFDLVVKDANDSTNYKMITDLEEYFDIEINALPFIMIGKRHWIGYESSMNETLNSVIEAAYLDEDMEYVDVLQNELGYKINSNSSVPKNKIEIGPAFFVIVVIGICIFLICRYWSIINKVLKLDKINKKYLLIGGSIIVIGLISVITVLVINGGKEKYYCYEGHTLSDKMCIYYDSYQAQVVCPSGFYKTHTNDCAQNGTGTILPNVKKTYSCPNGGNLSGDTCLQTFTYKAFTEDPNK